jgi:hypothetical protein
MGWKTPVVLFQSIVRLDKILGVLGLAFLGVGVGTWSQYFPWYAPYIAFGVLVLYGFLRANYEDLERLREDKNQAEDNEREAAQQRDTLRDRVNLLEYQVATRPRTEAEELKHSCCQLAAELYQFAGECFQEKLELLHKRQNAETEEERQDAAKELRPGPSSRFRGSIRFKYKTSFRDRATILLGKAAERGWTEPSDKDLAQHVEDDLAAIEGIASILSDICNRD